MKKKVIGFFMVFFVFVLALSLLAFFQTGKLSNISGYSVAVEEENNSSASYGLIISGILIGLLFAYIVKFIFESYERKSKGTEFKRTIDIDLS